MMKQRNEEKYKSRNPQRMKGIGSLKGCKDTELVYNTPKPLRTISKVKSRKTKSPCSVHIIEHEANIAGLLMPH